MAVLLIGVVLTVSLAITLPQKRDTAARRTPQFIKLALPVAWKNNDIYNIINTILFAYTVI